MQNSYALFFFFLSLFGVSFGSQMLPSFFQNHSEGGEGWTWQQRRQMPIDVNSRFLSRWSSLESKQQLVLTKRWITQWTVVRSCVLTLAIGLMIVERTGHLGLGASGSWCGRLKEWCRLSASLERWFPFTQYYYSQRQGKCWLSVLGKFQRWCPRWNHRKGTWMMASAVYATQPQLIFDFHRLDK